MDGVSVAREIELINISPEKALDNLREVYVLKSPLITDPQTKGSNNLHKFDKRVSQNLPGCCTDFGNAIVGSGLIRIRIILIFINRKKPGIPRYQNHKQKR